MDIQLFLAHADDHAPILEAGVPVASLLDAPLPAASELVTQRIAHLQGAPDALHEQRWALVAPKGPVGDRLLSLVEPLRRKREEEQRHEALIYRVDPDMNAVAAMNWIQREYRDAVGRVESMRPRYLAVLGGPDLISWDFQQILANESYVGRIAFDLDTHYESYVDKLVRVYAMPGKPRARALVHAVRDGSRATQEGVKHLVVPMLEWARAAQLDNSFDVDDLCDVPMSPVGSRLDPTTVASALLRESASTQAGLLFTMSHGAGVPKSGWKSAAEQRDFQGAMVLGPRGDLLTANDIARQAFLPGGMWFMFACFGAGTPAYSAYFPWLQRLHTLGFINKSATEVLSALPQAGEKPFVAALPQAALANPQGPLGFLGHVDLAWSWSFLDYDMTTTGLTPKNRADRFQSVLQAFAHGHRFGVAHHELVKFFRTANAELVALYDVLAQRTTADPTFVEDRVTQRRRATLWMQQQDLSAYVLLGDPAARLPIMRCPPGIAPARAPTRVDLDDDAADRVDAVLAILRGTGSVSETATRMRVPRDEVESWVEVFVEGGKAALSRHMRG